MKYKLTRSIKLEIQGINPAVLLVIQENIPYASQKAQYKVAILMQSLKDSQSVPLPSIPKLQ